jgi:hypothetical protein
LVDVSERSAVIAATFVLILAMWTVPGLSIFRGTCRIAAGATVRHHALEPSGPTCRLLRLVNAH